ncbi:histone-lysine N-methyltransferase eggless-like [Watersipora subatra]|uniref:histone-lysine N-methyltransferase eggless-like n=1 Tax=Watersipora subatra TaxID=2589382 RepID=UPI00355BF08F
MMEVDYDSPETKTVGKSNMAIAEAVREIHQTAKDTGGNIDPALFEKDDVKFVFRGTEEELCTLIKEVVLEDVETRAYAEKTDVMLNEWAKMLEKEEDENREREKLIVELERELELFRIEYEAVCQQRKAKELKAASSLSQASQARVTSANTSVETDDDIEIIEEREIPPANKRIAVGSMCYAVKNGDLWRKAFVTEIYPSPTGQPADEYYRVKMDRLSKVVKRYEVAYEDPPARSAMRGTRVIALYKEMSGAHDFYSGIVAEPPYTKNNHRYLIFFDDGCAQYTQQSDIRMIAHQFEKAWHGLQPDLLEFVKHYMETYNQRMILKLIDGQTVSCEKSGKWLKARCLKIDCSLVKVLFEAENVTEWIYRGSTRFEPLFGLQQKRDEAEKKRIAEREAKQKDASSLASQTPQPVKSSALLPTPPPPPSVAKPAKTLVYKAPPPLTKGVTANRPVSKYMSFQLRDEHAGNRTKVPYPNIPPTQFRPHACGRGCIKRDDNPSSYKGIYTLTIPIYVGFERYICRTKRTKSHYTSNKKFVVYRGPCGRRIRNNKEMGDYLFMTNSKLTIDLFSFEQSLHLFEPFKASHIMMNIPDISHGRELVPISCVNALNTGKPDPLVYSGVRMPQKDVNLNTNTDFMVCCDCTDNCQDKTKCACQKLTYEGQKFLQPSLPLEKSGYIYRRLDENIVTGVYECNSKCSCRKTCFNRVVQNTLSVRLQIFKTEKRGWGLRCLDDVPNGGFICIYAGQLLSEEGADQGGREYGDEYFAELDFIETCENVKEGYEEDVVDPDASSEEDKEKSDSDWEGSSSGSEVNTNLSVRKQLRPKSRRSKAGISEEEEAKSKKTEKESEEQTGEKKAAPKSIRSYFDEDLPYVMDAKTSGNLGRYLNHSCDPNVFVQNVFVDTHDPRFPWIAFFANTFIRAGSELTWDYGYQPGIVEGKVMYCYCGSSNCRGRLL